MIPMVCAVFGVNIEFVILIILIISVIILIKNKKILKIDLRRFVLSLMLFSLLFFLPIFWMPFIHEFSLFEVVKEFLNPPNRTGDVPGRVIGDIIPFSLFPLLLIISYLFSCFTISIYDKFKKKK